MSGVRVMMWPSEEGSWAMTTRTELVTAEKPLRARGSIALVVTVWAICAVGLVAMVVQGYWVDLLRYGPLFLVAAWGAWMLFGAPSVRIGLSAITFDNIVRSVRIPWGSVGEVEAGLTLRVLTPRGPFSAWAAPGGTTTSPTAAFGDFQQMGATGMGNAVFQLARVGNVKQMDALLGFDRSSLSSAGDIRAAIQQAWRAFGAVNGLTDEPADVTVTWHVRRLVVLGALVVLAVLGVVI
jgi:hypothetical protein